MKTAEAIEKMGAILKEWTAAQDDDDRLHQGFSRGLFHFADVQSKNDAMQILESIFLAYRRGHKKECGDRGVQFNPRPFDCIQFQILEIDKEIQRHNLDAEDIEDNVIGILKGALLEAMAL